MHLNDLENPIKQDRQFLLIGNIRNSRCFIERNEQYCLPIDKNSLSCFQKNFAAAREMSSQLDA